MPTKSGPALLKVKNPDGSFDGLIIDVHSTCCLTYSISKKFPSLP